jgi:hypothetical protein
MLIINFSNTPKQAFAHGFIKGLAAPMILFGNYTAPPLPEINWISLPSDSPDQSLANDWKNIGTDFKNAIVIYGKNTESQKSAAE